MLRFEKIFTCFYLFLNTGENRLVILRTSEMIFLHKIDFYCSEKFCGP